VDFALEVPGGYAQQDVNPPPDPVTNKAPPSTPLRARFDSPDGQVTISVVVKGAQTVKPSLFQVRMPARRPGPPASGPSPPGVLAGGRGGGGQEVASSRPRRTRRRWGPAAAALRGGPAGR
jgi:hypothetical protein